ncbi:MAG TPA: hypothetical protein VM344_03885 [Vitreimonas sp.]|nr:hypothetical protein [Vitreimonas sp.]
MTTPRAEGPAPSGLSALPIHPLLLAAFPVLFLFGENTVQQVSLRPLWTPLLLSVVGATALMLFATAVLRDMRRGALAASLLVALFFSFGHVWNLLTDIEWAADRTLLAAGWAMFAIAGIFEIRHGGRWVLPATRFLNFAAILLVGFNVVRVGEFALGASVRGPEPVSAAPPISVDIDATDRRPDIYYVILDRYSNRETLETVYGVDNSPFFDELERRGFTIAEDSWANYFKTGLSLASSLDMEFLDGDALEAQGGPSSFRAVYSALSKRLTVPATLKSLGYEYVHIASNWEPSATNVDADRVLQFEGDSDFSSALLSTTAWSLTEPIERPSDVSQKELDVIQLGNSGVYRAHTLYQLERLHEVVARPGPKYVFAHFLLPHSPWRFNADGSQPTAEEIAARTNAESYLQQLQYANGQMVAWLDRVLDVPEDQRPIVIIQSDEGEFPDRYRVNEREFDWLDATATEIQWKFGILNAMYLPGKDPSQFGFNDRTSPVNNFRVVFNAYFGADLPMLPDKTFISPGHRNIYDFREYPRP